MTQSPATQHRQESHVELTFDAKKSKEVTLDGDTVSIQSDNSGTTEDELAHGSGMLGTIMNMTNTIIGSGILSIPYSTAQVGWALALVIMAMGATFTMFGLHLLNSIADRMGGRNTSFGDACRQSYSWLALVADFLVFFTLWAVAVIYMTIASGKMLPDFMKALVGGDADPDAVYFQSWFWLLICWGCFAAPLSTLKSLWFLAYTSMAAVICVFWTTFVVFAYSINIFDPCDGKAADCQGQQEVAIWDFAAIMRAFPVFVLGFCVGPVLFNIYNAMDRQSAKRMDISAGCTITLVSVLYVIIAMCGYFTYGQNVADNILDSYPISVPASIARLGTAFVVTVSYPLLMHAARDSIIHAIGTLVTMCGEEEKGITLTDNTTKLGNIMFYVVITILNIAALGFAYFQININMLLSITGAIGTVNLSFTLPAVIYWKMFEEDGMTVRRMLCVPFAVIGLVSMCICLWANLS